MIKLAGCIEFVTNFEHNVLRTALEPLKPLLLTSIYEQRIDLCLNLQIMTRDYFYTAKREPKFLNWTLVQMVPTNSDGSTKLIKLLNTVTTFNFTIPQLFLNQFTKYKLAITYESILSLTGITILTFDTASNEKIMIKPFKPLFSLFNRLEIPIQVNLTRLACNQMGQIFEVPSQYSVTLNQFFYDSLTPALNSLKGVKYDLQNSQTQFRLNLPSYTTQSNKNYVYFVNVTVPDSEITGILENFFFVEQDQTITVVEGGNRLQSYQKALIIKGHTRDMNFPEEIDVLRQKDYSWSCLNLNNMNACKFVNGSEIIIKNTHNLELPKNSLMPYNTFIFTLEGISEGMPSQGSVAIIVTEEDLPALEVGVQDYILASPINLDNELIFSLNYAFDNTTTSDDLYYSVAVIYQKEVVATFQVYYLTFKFTPWDYFFDFKPEVNKISFRVSAYNPKFYMPSLSQIHLLFNIPPRNCVIMASKNMGTVIQDSFDFQVLNCISERSPLQFKFGYYLSSTEFKNDLLYSSNFNYNSLSQFSQNSKISTILPSSSDLNTNQLVLMAVVMDIAGAVNNFTMTIEMKLPVTLEVTKITPILQNSFDNESIEVQSLVMITSTLTRFNSTSSKRNIRRSLGQLDNKITEIGRVQTIEDLQLYMFSRLQIYKNKSISEEIKTQIMKGLNILLKMPEIRDQLDPYNIESLLSGFVPFIEEQRNSNSELNDLTQQETQDINDQHQQKSVTNNLKASVQTLNHFLDKSFELADQNLDALNYTELIIQKLNSTNNSNSLNGGNNNSNLSEILLQLPTSQDIQQINLNDLTMLLNLDNILNNFNNNSLPNEARQEYISPTVIAQSQKLTAGKLCKQIFGAEIFYFEDQNILETYSTLQSNITITFDQFFDVKQQQFSNNPYITDQSFIYKESKSSVLDASILHGNDSLSSSQLKDLCPLVQNTNASYQFPIYDTDLMTCLSQAEIQWQSEECRQIIDPNDKGKVLCECNDYSPTTVVSDIFSILKKNKAQESFTKKGLQSLSRFQFWTSSSFYILLSSIIFYLLSLFQVLKIDKIEMQKYKELKNQPYEKFKKLNVDLISDDNQNDLQDSQKLDYVESSQKLTNQLKVLNIDADQSQDSDRLKEIYHSLPQTPQESSQIFSQQEDYEKKAREFELKGIIPEISLKFYWRCLKVITAQTH